MNEAAITLARFTEAAVEWAAGGRGVDLVMAATQALADGLDSPSLRRLAGAPRAFADDEAHELATDTFAELGISVEARLSDDAIVAGARLYAQRFLASGASGPRQLARDLYRMYVQAEYHPELVDFTGFDDQYALIEEGYYPDDGLPDLDCQVIEAARVLAQGAAGI